MVSTSSYVMPRLIASSPSVVIVASYSGDGNFGGSVSTVLIETVTALNTVSLADFIARIGSLPLNAGQQNSLLAKLRAAQASLMRGNRTAAVNQLGAFINEVQALAQSGQLPAATAADLIAEAQAVIASI
jgi:hypothetical protein